MSRLRDGIASYQHNLFNSIKKVAFLNDNLRPIPELSNLYVIDSSILMAYLKGDNSTKSIVYPFDDSSAYGGLSAFLALFQVESDQYQRGLGKRIMKISEEVIADYFNEKGKESVMYGGRLVPLDFCMRFNFKTLENYDFAVTDEYGKVHRFNFENSSVYYILCQIYKKLGFNIEVVPEVPRFKTGEKEDKITLISKDIKTNSADKSSLDKKWVRPDKYLPDNLNNFELIY